MDWVGYSNYENGAMDNSTVLTIQSADCFFELSKLCKFFTSQFLGSTDPQFVLKINCDNPVIRPFVVFNKCDIDMILCQYIVLMLTRQLVT